MIRFYKIKIILRNISKVISIVFHPVFIPLYGLFLYVNIQNPATLNLRMIDDEVFFKLAVFPILLFSIIFPLFSLLIMYRSRMIHSFSVESRQERMPILFLGVIYYGITYYFIRSLDIVYHHAIFGLFLSFLTGGILLSLLSLLITSRWKISLHAMGVGALAGAFLAFSQEFHPIANYNEVIAINTGLILLVGVVGSQRLLVNAHNINQVLLGALLGIVVEYVFVTNHLWL